jgi:cell division protein FtsB
MRGTEKKRQTLRKKLLFAGLAFVLIVFIIASFFGKKGVFEIYKAQKEKDALLKEKAQYEEKITKLEREIEELKENPRAVDETVRDKLWMVEPEESIIIKNKKTEKNKKK